MANNRGADEDRAAAEVADRLRQRGVSVTGAERSDDLADLLSAVERFEKTVEGHFVLPRREHGESIRTYIIRIDEAAAGLRRHPRRPD